MTKNEAQYFNFPHACNKQESSTCTDCQLKSRQARRNYKKTNTTLKCINDFGVCLEKGRKHLKTRSEFYWLNSQLFIWHSNHTARVNNIVDITAIACRLQEEDDDDIWERIFSSSSPPPPPHPLFTNTVTRHKSSFELPRTISSPIHSPPPSPSLRLRQIEMDSLFRSTQEFRKFQLTPIKDD